MKAEDHGRAAFPHTGDFRIGNGMTLLDWFAGQAMAGFCARPNRTLGPLTSAAESYAYAEAMIAERKRRGLV